jgi:hypothetical protein
MKPLYGGASSAQQAKKTPTTTTLKKKIPPTSTTVMKAPQISLKKNTPTKEIVPSRERELRKEIAQIAPQINPKDLPDIVEKIKRQAAKLSFLMGYHLQCDVAHDFGTQKGVPIYNINGLLAKDKVNAIKIDEDGCVKFFLYGDGMGIIDNLKARMNREQVFSVPDKTASFKNWKAPVLFGGGNDKVGIVQDAGEFITIRLGAQNVITFGSILDPAGKPKDKDAKPIWYNPGAETSLNIPLAPFGFDSNVISSITISELRGGALVSAVFETPLGMIDGVKMSPATTSLKQKPLNNTEIEKAGFFTSIKKAEDIGVTEPIPAEALSGTTRGTFLAKYKTYFYVGKTLGDAMLVASAMPEIYDNSFVPRVPNPFVSVQGGRWEDWISGDTVSAPSILILKTGDRLNWLRAIIFNVGAIYEDQAKDGRSFKQYRYFPGTVDSAAIIDAIRSDFDKIAIDVMDRYAALASSIRDFDLNNTSFAPGGMKEISPTDKVKVERARELLNQIADDLVGTSEEPGGLCRVVLDWLREKKDIANSPTYNNDEKLRELYDETVKKVNACCPQVSSLLIEKGRQEPYIAHKVIVADVPQDASDWPLKRPVDIMLRSAFSRIRSTSNDQTISYEGTDIDRRFAQMLNQSLTGGGQEGGAYEYIPPDGASFEKTVDETVKTYDPEEKALIGGAQKGGAFFSLTLMKGMKDEEESEAILSGFPRIRDFLLYMKSMDPPVSNVQQRFLIILDVVLRKESNVFHDPDLLNELVQEFELLCGIAPSSSSSSSSVGEEPDVVAAKSSPQYIQINTGNAENVPITSFDPPSNLDLSTSSTVLFNAYAYNVDTINSDAVFGEGSASGNDFKIFENIYLSKLPFGKTRRGPYLKFSVTGTRSSQPLPSSSSNAAEGPAAAGSGATSYGIETKRDGDGDVGVTGGLRTRRPLYSNARTTASRDVDGISNDEGLRKRTGTRTTARVRKSSRSTRRRR